MLTPAEHAAPWRYWRLTHWLVHHAYTLGVISANVWSSDPPTRGFISWIAFSGRRPYILGLTPRQWRKPLHLMRYRHWPNDLPMGLCGKCAPWVCCGAVGYDHLPDCEKA